MVENGIGLIAGSLPPLRTLFARFFRDSSNSSAPSDRPKPIGDATIGGTPFSMPTHLDSLSPKGKTISFASSGGRWKGADDDSSSVKGIIRERRVDVETESMSDENTNY